MATDCFSYSSSSVSSLLSYNCICTVSCADYNNYHPLCAFLGTKKGILMIEGEASFLPEEQMMRALKLGHAAVGTCTSVCTVYVLYCLYCTVQYYVHSASVPITTGAGAGALCCSRFVQKQNCMQRDQVMQIINEPIRSFTSIAILCTFLYMFS